MWDCFLESARAFLLLRLSFDCHSGRSSFIFTSLPCFGAYPVFVHSETSSFPSGKTHAAPGGCFRRSECTLRGLMTKLLSLLYNESYCPLFLKDQDRKCCPENKKSREVMRHIITSQRRHPGKHLFVFRFVDMTSIARMYLKICLVLILLGVKSMEW